MLSALLSLGSIMLLCGWSVPLCQRWLAAEPPALRWPFSFGLSVGGATLLLAVLGFNGLTRALVWVVLLVLAGGGLLLGERPQLAPAAQLTQWLREWRSARPAALAQFVLLLAGAVALGHATYYPFIGDDEISRYGYLARVIFRGGYIGPDERGYPLLMPLAYAVPFFASGQLVEQVAKLIPLAFGALTVCATGGLARHWFGVRAGWYAAVLLAVTPPFLAWATVGYVDIPAALYIVLAAYAGDRWLKTASPGWALLAGAVAGLALWAKQAGFVAFSGLAVCGWLLLMRGPRKALAGGSLLLFAAFCCGGWWYFRNALYDGWLNAVPDAGLFHVMQAPRQLLQLVPFAGNYADFGYLAAAVYLAGCAWAVTQLRQPAVRWCLLWCGPYTLLWWWQYSYDARLLLTVLPFFAILAGAALAAVRSRFYLRANSFWQMAAALLFLIACVWQARLGGALEWLRNPAATYAQRLERAKGDMYPVVQFIEQKIGPREVVCSMDVRLRSYLLDFDIRNGYPALEQMKGCDHLVVGSWAENVYKTLGIATSPLSELDNAQQFVQEYRGPEGNITVYKVLHP